MYSQFLCTQTYCSVLEAEDSSQATKLGVVWLQGKDNVNTSRWISHENKDT